ncbi:MULTISPECIES: TrkH family potassium uptake protein [Halomonadaceae]|uniref:Trk system potassium uptake protein n=1 Tax=Vreelandella halophila TaxID=86177 RepID=A0A9X5B4W2_9GAMM|nr:MULTISPECIES: TrkH family potassium uptake protein [Halomonas]MYL25904.1 potassium transporter [Halomonas utahensis]MYL73534.1 potassium transporter [Halomonas sp. 22501_18_FS]
MRYGVIARILGLLMMVFSLTLLPPVVVSLIYDDGQAYAFLEGFGVVLLVGALVWWPNRGNSDDLRVRDGFLITSLFWIVLSLAGSVPFFFSSDPSMRYVDALFEAVSGLTTTGATVLTGLDALPESILWYRQQLQWLGGIGIIVLAVAILPMLGIGGMQLYRAEVPGPVKDNKLTPRIAETAKALWYIYVGLTIACALAYWVAGMTLFDAIGHSFSTVAIGGFSTHDASMGHFDSHAIKLIASFFLFLSGVNFALHFMAWNQRGPWHYFRDPEFRFYAGVMGGACVATVGILILTATYDPWHSLSNGIFQVLSIATTAGFTSADFHYWPSVLPVMLILMAFMGGCGNSTAGGMKAMRILLIYRQGAREIRRILHPNAVIPIKLGHRPVSDRILQAVWGFFSMYMVVFVVLLLINLAMGLDQVTAWTAVVATLTNLGPGLGEVSSTFQSMPDVTKWSGMAAMILGRLEIFTLLVLFTPEFWRR